MQALNEYLFEEHFKTDDFIRYSKNKGNAFEHDYVSNFEEVYKSDIENLLNISLKNCQITFVGGNNTKRPLSKNSKTLYLGTPEATAVGSIIKDVLIETADGNEYNISLKAGNKVSFNNTGIKMLFPEKIFKEYAETGVFVPQTKNNVNGQELLDMFGIDGTKMAEVFNNYKLNTKRRRSQKDEVDVLDTVKKGCFMDFIESVIGCNYILVHKAKNDINIYDLRTYENMKKFIGKLESAKVLYPNDGNAKSVHIIIETTGLQLDFEIRSKHRGVYPDEMMCVYRIKHQSL